MASSAPPTVYMEKIVCVSIKRNRAHSTRNQAHGTCQSRLAVKDTTIIWLSKEVGGQSLGWPMADHCAHQLSYGIGNCIIIFGIFIKGESSFLLDSILKFHVYWKLNCVWEMMCHAPLCFKSK